MSLTREEKRKTARNIALGGLGLGGLGYLGYKKYNAGKEVYVDRPETKIERPKIESKVRDNIVPQEMVSTIELENDLIGKKNSLNEKIKGIKAGRASLVNTERSNRDRINLSRANRWEKNLQNPDYKQSPLQNAFDISLEAEKEKGTIPKNYKVTVNDRASYYKKVQDTKPINIYGKGITFGDGKNKKIKATIADNAVLRKKRISNTYIPLLNDRGEQYLTITTPKNEVFYRSGITDVTGDSDQKKVKSYINRIISANNSTLSKKSTDYKNVLEEAKRSKLALKEQYGITVKPTLAKISDIKDNKDKRKGLQAIVRDHVSVTNTLPDNLYKGYQPINGLDDFSIKLNKNLAKDILKAGVGYNSKKPANIGDIPYVLLNKNGFREKMANLGLQIKPAVKGGSFIPKNKLLSLGKLLK